MAEPSTPRILIFYQLADVYERMIKARLPDADIVAIKDLKDEDGFRRHLPDAEILMSFAVPAEALLTARSLRWIQAVSAGVDFLYPVREQLAHVIVTNARGIHAEIMGDYAMGAMMMLQSDAPRMFRNQMQKKWERWARSPLAGRTVGIVGLGLIGQGVASRARASGMTVLGTRRSGAPVAGVDRVYKPDAIADMLARSDFVVIAVPGIRQTNGLFGQAEIRAMKPGAFLINISRGSVADEKALIDALREGRIAGACLDVFAVEPLPADNPLWSMPNVIVTPHIAGLRDDTPELVTEIFLDNLGRYKRGEAMRNRVDLSRGY